MQFSLSEVVFKQSLPQLRQSLPLKIQNVTFGDVAERRYFETASRDARFEGRGHDVQAKVYFANRVAGDYGNEKRPYARNSSG